MDQPPPPPELPPALHAYFAAANAGDADAAAASFTANATVADEARTHRGPDAIRAWVEEATRNYRPQAEPLRWERRGDLHAVTARVSGSFPGSPIELTFAFVLAEDGRIASLEIG